MKNTLFLLLLLVFIACDKTDVQPVVHHQNIVTVAPGDVRPIPAFESAALTERVIKNFESSLILDENNQIIGGRFDEIRSELSEQDAAKFWESIFGEPVVFVNELKEINLTYSLSLPCGAYMLENVVSVSSLQAGGICKTAPGYFCRQFDCP